MIRNPRLTILTVCVFALAFGLNQAQAQTKPFKIVGEGPGTGRYCTHSGHTGTSFGGWNGDRARQIHRRGFLPNP